MTLLPPFFHEQRLFFFDLKSSQKELKDKDSERLESSNRKTQKKMCIQNCEAEEGSSKKKKCTNANNDKYNFKR